jgi:uncharacterized membrane protein
MDIFIDFVQWFVDGFAESIDWLLGYLPSSPTSSFVNKKPELVTLSHITWFIPFPTMLLHFTAILSAIAVYYVYRVIGRWLKVVRS